jgi:uncharacterized membrane protein YccC
MTTRTLAGRAAGLRGALRPEGRPAEPGWPPVWSVPAALRAMRATLVIPTLLALTSKVIGNPQMAVFAVFGGFGALVMSTFGGSRLDKAKAHLGLAVTGSVAIVIGTLVSGSALLAGLVTLPVAFAIYFAGVAGPNAVSGVTAALLAYVLPVASAGGAATIGSRLEGWWLASVASTAAVLTLSVPSPGDRLRRSAAALARALSHLVRRAAEGTATAADRDASQAAKQELITLFAATPYRPIGLAAADQALASLISLLEWCTALTCETMDGHLDLNDAAPPDRDLLAESAAALSEVAGLLAGREAVPSPERVWQARAVSAANLRSLSGDPDVVRRMADFAFHAQAIGLTASSAAADALIAAGRLDPESADARRHRAAVHSPRPRIAGRIVADASIRSLWFRNSARGAAALAAAVAVAKLTGVEHAFWVVLGTLSVLRSSAGATGVTAIRGLAGTVLGFIVGAALVVGIGTSPVALWIALPLAVLVATYTPGTAPFMVGQAAFTVMVVVLFNLLVPAGWQVGLVRVEDVAIGCGVSVVVGLLFWPRGASALVGDNLADAIRAGAAYLSEATAWALGLPEQQTDQATAAVAASSRLDDAVRGFLTEQGSKRIASQDLWTLAMSALRLRLTAESLASLPGLEWSRGPAALHPVGASVRTTLVRESDELAGFYNRIAAQVDWPGHDRGPVAAVSLPQGISSLSAEPCTVGPAHYHPEALWVRDHLSHLASHSAGLVGPASRFAALRRSPWWR